MQPKIVTVSRFVLGAVFVIFGLNGFAQFLPMPAPTGQAAVFMQGLAAAGRARPARRSLADLPSPSRRRRGATPLSKVLAEMRADERA